MMVENSKFLTWLLKKAEQLGLDAGHSGRMDDGGERELRTQVEVYQAGQLNQLPRVWDDYRREFLRESDPEYEKYLELKKKFG